MKKQYYFTITIFIIIIDQTIKKIIEMFLKKGETRNFLGQIVKLNYVTNKGGAFSIRRACRYYSNYFKYNTCWMFNLLYIKKL